MKCTTLPPTPRIAGMSSSPVPTGCENIGVPSAVARAHRLCRVLDPEAHVAHGGPVLLESLPRA